MSDSFLFPTNDVKNKNRKKLFGNVTLRNHRHAYPLGWPARSLCMFLYDFEWPHINMKFNFRNYDELSLINCSLDKIYLVSCVNHKMIVPYILDM